MSCGNPTPWICWSAAAVLLVVTTRNPILLGLAAIAVIVVRSSLHDAAGVESLSWRIILRLGMIVAPISVLFNLLTVHVGDDVFAHLPGEIPIMGGALTLNALVYGLAGGLALISLILIAATFASAVDRGALIRLLPASFGTAGTAAIVALSIFPQTLRAVSEVRQAQLSRGFKMRSIRDLEPMIVPVLHLGLEHAFELAESVETRGFGHQAAVIANPSGLKRITLPLGLILASTGVIVAGLGHLLVGCLVLAAGIVAVLSTALTHQPVRRSRYRPVVWSVADLIRTGSAAISILLLLITVAFTSSLQYSPYPALGWPGVSVTPLVAVLLLVVPVFVPTESEAV